MERAQPAAHRRRLLIAGAVGLIAVILLRDVLAALAFQLAAALVLMQAALPLCRWLEHRMPASIAAVLSLLIWGAGATLLLMLLAPPVVRQIQQLMADLPALVDWAQAQVQRIASALQAQGMDVAPVRDELFLQLGSRAGTVVSQLAATLARGIAGISRLLLSPLLAFYLLRDRKRIAIALTLLLPVKYRARGVRATREMRRETAAFLRGQLLLSLSVGVLTALGLLLTRTPGWLLLGLLMGVLELVPYIGPVIAGAPAVLLALQNGWVSALWTLAALFTVQQIEGTFLSPRLLAGATQLHPMAVLLLISAGGMVGGALGMVLVIPAVVSLRGALRGWRE